jgi:hypothetical protein
MIVFGVQEKLCLGTQREQDPLHLKLEVELIIILKNAIFWDVMPYGSCKIQHLGES